MNSRSTIGIVFLVLGGTAGVAVGLFLVFQRNDGLTRGGFVLGAGFGAVIVVVLLGLGIAFLAQGRRESSADAERTRQRRLLDILNSRGRVNLKEMAVELQLSVGDIRGIVERLAGMELFSGYANWDKGVLYSAEAGKLRDSGTCANCGGAIELVGKGTTLCPYCGAQYFLA